ncbi:MAG: RluA family pseudouridine synthase [Bdellovibrionales bacterium]|nr:RluA family pseudouridine synthase [Bdellovibrionales bacterium]
MSGRKFTLFSGSSIDDRADRYLHDLFDEFEEIPLLSRSQIQKLMDQGLILVNGAPVKPKDRIPECASIELTVPAPTEISLEPENLPLEVLFEDSHLIVVNKAPGMTVHPSETQKSGTLVNALLHHIKDLSGIGGKLRPGIVHRIDKDTSGALVISKTDDAHAGLSRLFSTHAIERKYWAFCHGSPRWEDEFVFQSAIGRNPNDRKKMAVLEEGGKNSISRFRLQRSFQLSGKNPFCSWIEATLETGRTHQVRVHLTHLGHSLLGDPTYGTPTENQPKWKAIPEPVRNAVKMLPGQALHARILGFKHPITGENLHFEAPLFPELQKLFDTLKSF